MPLDSGRDLCHTRFGTAHEIVFIFTGCSSRQNDTATLATGQTPA